MEKIELPVRVGLSRTQCVARKLEHETILPSFSERGDARGPAFPPFSQLPVRTGKRWKPQRLAYTSLLMAWDEGQSLTSRFEHACDSARAMNRHWKLGETYQGFTAALVHEGERLSRHLTISLQQQMRQLAGRWWTCRGWCALAVDGTRLEAPHTLANEETLHRAGRDKCGPQAAMTMLMHLGVGLPWDFRVGPVSVGEQTHFKEMIPSLPEGSLVVADAGFLSYEVAEMIQKDGRFFLMRVGRNKTLLKKLLRTREPRDRVYLWPQMHRDKPPIALRLISLTKKGKTVYLVTNVLDEDELSVKDASILYQLRWGEEVYYRSFKQTMNRRRLLSRTGATCLAEATWTFLGLWVLGWMTVRRQVRAGQNPIRWSMAQARDAVRKELQPIRRRKRQTSFATALTAAVIPKLDRRRAKASRNYPRKKRNEPPGPPKIESATPQQRQQAKRLVQQPQRAA